MRGQTATLPIALGATAILAQLVAVATIATYQPQGYAINPYAQLPAAYWVALAAMAASGLVLATSPRPDWARAGFAIVLGTAAQVWLIPRSLGFLSYGRGDQLTHLGTVRGIIRDGHVGADVIYPSAHFQAASVSLVSGTSVPEAAYIIGVGASLSLVVGLVALSRLFMGMTKPVAAGTAVLVSVPLYSGWLHFTMLPNFVFFALTPTLLLVLMRTATNRAPPWRLSLILLLLIAPFGHPVVLLFTLFAIGVVAAGSGAMAFVQRRRAYALAGYALLLGVVFIMWFLASTGYQRRFADLVAAFKGGSTEAVVVEGVDKGAALAPTLLELLRLALFYGGRYAIPMAVIGIWFTRKWIRGRWQSFDVRDRTILGWFVATVAFQFVLVANRFLSQDPTRALNVNYTLFALVPLLVLALTDLLGHARANRRSILAGFIALTLFLTTVFGALDSPLVLKASQQVAHNEMSAAEWVFDARGTDLIYDNLGGFGTRFGDYLLSREDRKSSLDIPNRPRSPDHFGYDEDWIGSTGTKYLVITTLGEQLYQTLYERVGRYNATDFSRVASDPRLAQIFDSTDVKVYYQTPKQIVDI